MLFRNARGQPLTRDGVAYLLDKYTRAAAQHLPTLRKRRVTPHVLRHSCAVALLQSGMDITVIRDYLGHVSIATTNRYVATNLAMKQTALEAFWKRSGLATSKSTTTADSARSVAFSGVSVTRIITRPGSLLYKNGLFRLTVLRIKPHSG